jgi:hypothetical protein
MQMIWKLAVGTVVVAGLGFGSIAAMAVASSLTIDDEPGRVQNSAPVSVGDGSNGTGESDPSEVPGSTSRTTEAPTPAAVPVPTDPTSPIAVPPAGSQTIDDDDTNDDADDLDDTDDLDDLDDDSSDDDD